ncbi:unnamed protein product, partial [Meganyctiphanes norvegica]
MRFKVDIMLRFQRCISVEFMLTSIFENNNLKSVIYSFPVQWNYNSIVRNTVTQRIMLLLTIHFLYGSTKETKANYMVTNVSCMDQYWKDYKLKWEPDEYGGVKMLHVPSDHIWRPDIVLYNNADGNFEVTLATKATLHSDGMVEWKPPAIYKSSCEIDVEYFPFDEQTCVMKFGSWTYDGFQVDLRHIDEKEGDAVVQIGVDLTEFYMSVEWDILEVPAVRHEKYYTCCDEPYLDITFNITMRRKTLFYTVNLIIPCMGISFLTVLVFYLPSDSGEKVSLSISILLSLTVFFLLLAEIIPPTSLVVPLLGKFVLFTMILDTLSICVTVVVLNVHFRSPQTHTMAPWVRRVFINILPRLLVMRRPQYQMDRHRHVHDPMDPLGINGGCKIHGPAVLADDLGVGLNAQHTAPQVRYLNQMFKNQLNKKKQAGEYSLYYQRRYCPEITKAFEGVRYIAEDMRKEEESTRVKEDWKYVAMVLDRLFLWIFTLAVLVGTAGIILQAPTLYDERDPIDVTLSEIRAIE